MVYIFSRLSYKNNIVILHKTKLEVGQIFKKIQHGSNSIPNKNISVEELKMEKNTSTKCWICVLRGRELFIKVYV